MAQGVAFQQKTLSFATGGQLSRTNIYTSLDGDGATCILNGLYLADGTSKIHLTNIGLAHFFRREEFIQLLPGFSVVDPCLTTYYLPRHEARKRGYEEYLQSMWTVFAVK